MYEQSLSHEDSFCRIMCWEIEDAKARLGCLTLKQVASDLYQKKGTMFVEQMLGNLHGMGFQLNSKSESSLEGVGLKHSIVEVFSAWRTSAVKQIKEWECASWRDWV